MPQRSVEAGRAGLGSCTAHCTNIHVGSSPPLQGSSTYQDERQAKHRAMVCHCQQLLGVCVISSRLDTEVGRGAIQQQCSTHRAFLAMHQHGRSHVNASAAEQSVGCGQSSLGRGGGLGGSISGPHGPILGRMASLELYLLFSSRRSEEIHGEASLPLEKGMNMPLSWGGSSVQLKCAGYGAGPPASPFQHHLGLRSPPSKPVAFCSTVGLACCCLSK